MREWRYSMKKFMIFLTSLVPIILILVVQLTSTYIEGTKYVSVESIKVEQTPSEICKLTSENTEYELKVNVYPISATNKNLIYTSSDENIAVVDENGKITFKDFGEVTITVKSAVSESINTSSKFYVTDTKPHRIELTSYPETMIVGETFFIKSKVIPNEAENKTVTYSSSDSDIASVFPDGKISAVAPGKATITLTTINGVTESFDLEVIMPVSGIYIPAEQKYRITGKNTIDVPDAIVSPDVATNKKVIYSSDNPDLAYIENNTEIIFNKKGTATFTATTEDGGFSETFSVYYTGGFVISAEISSNSKYIEKDHSEGERFTLNYDIFPLNADLSNIRFVSSNESVISVDGKELIVKGGGKAVITMYAKTGEGEITSVANVYIKRAATEIEVGDVEVNTPNFMLDYKILPLDSTDDVSFTVNSNIATVTDDGMVTFKDYGEVKITIITTSGVEKEITARYTKAGSTIKEINQNNQELSVNYQDSFTLLFDAKLGFGMPTYSIDDTEILNYNDETKEFTAIKGGTVNIIATDGTSVYTVTVKVTRFAERIEIFSDEVDLTTESDIVTAKKEITINANVLPIDTTNKKPNYSVNNLDVAEISDTGKLTFKRAGIVVVTVKVDNISIKKTIRSTFGMPDSFELSVSEYVFEDVENSFEISFKSVSPIDCDLTELQKIFASTNTAVATVDENGLITAIGKGNARITVQIGSAVKTIDVEVKVKTKEVYILYNGSKITKGSILGESVQLSASILPLNANDKNVIWEVETGCDLASVDNSGLLTFKSGCYGTVKVKVSTIDSGINAYVNVTRLVHPEGIGIDIYINDELASDSTITVNPNDNADINLEIRATFSNGNLLDSEIALEYIFKDIKFTSICDTGLTVDISSLGNGYYSISKDATVNKKLSATVTFSIEDESRTIYIDYLNLQGLELELNNEDDVDYGLEQKRVFGTQKFATDTVGDYTVSNKFIISYKRKPVDNSDILYWFSSNKNIAYVNEEGHLVVVSENVTTETQVTITVGNAADLDDCSVKAYYTYTFVPGYNVYTNNDYVRAVSKNYNLVLQTTLGTESDNKGGSFAVLQGASAHRYTGNLFGNGYTLNFANYTDIKDITFCGNLRNVTIKRTDYDNSKNNYKDKIISLGGSSISERFIEYCVFQNTQKVWVGIENASYKLTLRNCIIEHCSQTGLQVGSQNTAAIYFENMILADVSQAAVDFQGGNLYVKGFLDVYNFRKADDFDIVQKFLINAAYSRREFEKYIVKVNKTKYANIAIFVTSNSNESVNFWNKAMNEYVLNVDDADNGTGLNYEKVYASSLTKNYYLFCPPISGNENNYINSPDVLLNEQGRAKVKRLYNETAK